MSQETIIQDPPSEKYLDELLAELSAPVHKRLIEAYQGDDPVQSMESELGKILIEVLRCED
jgi:hypothetical protein